ncbi:type II toxin-antitoxin system HicA family toxin [Deinococcus sp. YIM 134068]|uniref:type II toxin-antitoxin system HicA family toxin n=1 Tax=Deinococcus lichenicola TaxID=3118910 RepID=UPI002F943668
MPRKIRDLIRELERAGFELRSVRGSHRKYVRGEVTVIISGSAGDDAKKYQERAVQDALGRE